MKFVKRFTAICCAICFSTFFASCEKASASVDLYYFNTEIHVQVEGTSLSQDTIEQIDGRLNELHNLYRIQNQNTSFTAQFNALQDGGSLTAPSHVIDLLTKCKEYYFFTQGKFNPAVYPLVKLWQFAPNYPVNDFTPPSQYDCEQIIYSEVTDFENGVIIDGNVVKKPLAGTMIDLGGIVKGVAADEIGQVLKNAGHQKGYVNVGGSSLYLLETESLGVTHPRKSGQLLQINTPLKNVSVSTSGDYQKYYEHDGVRYSHLISGLDGLSAHTGIQSATVICPDGTFADAMSTALCLCEYSADNQDNELFTLIGKILKKHLNASIYVAIEKDGVKTLVTNQIKGENFTLYDNEYTVVNI